MNKFLSQTLFFFIKKILRSDRKNIIAWIALFLSTSFACLWTFWGIFENFHEGWYYESWGLNLGMMFGQYLLFAIVFVALILLAIRWNRLGAVLYVLIGILIPILKIQSFSAIFFFSVPLCIIGVLFWFGKYSNRKWAYRIAGLLPLLCLIVFAVEPVFRVYHRIDDKNYESRIIKGNEVELVWAPEGPGWTSTPQEMANKSWNDVIKICAHLSENGKTLMDSVQNIWRLPTIDEAVRSLTRNGKNAGGEWHAETAKPTYHIMPDKESPLWKIHSPVIYWWTSTQVNDSTAYRLVYNGGVQALNKKIMMGSLGFRAVKQIK